MMIAVRSIATVAISAFVLLPGVPDAAPVKIGVLETLSGPQAASGQAYRDAVRYAFYLAPRKGCRSSRGVRYEAFEYGQLPIAGSREWGLRTNALLGSAELRSTSSEEGSLTSWPGTDG